MNKDKVFFQEDWSELDKKIRDEIDTRILRQNVIRNFKIHDYEGKLWTSGYVGITRLKDVYDKNLKCSDGSNCVVEVRSSYQLDPFMMLDTVIADKEYSEYIKYQKKTEPLYAFFEKEPLIETNNNKFGGEILLAVSFIKICEDLCRKKLKAGMSFEEANLNGKVRGKIYLKKHISRNLITGRKDRIYCIYPKFSVDTPENRILKYALGKAAKIIRNACTKMNVELSFIQSSIRYCSTLLDDVRDIVPIASTFGSAKTNGMYSYYKKPIELAKLLCKRNSGIPTGYNENGKGKYYVMPYVINMEQLFEFYARAVMRKRISEGLELEKYRKEVIIRNSKYKSHLISECYPDIMIKNKDGVVVEVYDAKYKKKGKPDRDDTHQLLSYSLLLDIDRCGFIMPGSDEEPLEFEISRGTENDINSKMKRRMLMYNENFIGTDEG